MLLFLRLPFLFFLLMFTQSTQAEPDFKIPPIQESMKKMYQIQQKDLPLKTNIIVCLLLFHRKRRKN